MLQTRTVEPTTLGLLKNLMSQSCLDPFFLVGGTALALQMGHRFSIDLDFFTNHFFDKDELLENLQTSFDVSVEVETKNIFITNINGVKVDFVKINYPAKYQTNTIDGVRMLDIRDIAPMKLSAVTQRGTKKDFYDLYFLLDIMPLQSILEHYVEKFQNQTLFHVIKSLNYFDDAEKFSDPIVFDESVTWGKVKSTLVKEVKKLYA